MLSVLYLIKVLIGLQVCFDNFDNAVPDPFVSEEMDYSLADSVWSPHYEIDIATEDGHDFYSNNYLCKNKEGNKVNNDDKDEKDSSMPKGNKVRRFQI